MKKLFTRLSVLALAIVMTFSIVGCNEIENGIIIKYATVTLDFYGSDGEVASSEELVIKLYYNYAPDTVDRFIALAEAGFYNGTCVNNLRSGWFTAGGYKFGDSDKLEQVTTPLGYMDGSADGKAMEFENAGWKGNGLTATQGAVFLYRPYDDPENESTYGKGANQFGILTSSSSVFTVKKYAYFGKIISDDWSDIITKINDLQSETVDDDTLYNYYYNGGLKAVIDRRRAEFEANEDITAEDIETVCTMAEGYMNNDAYDEFYDVADQFITSNANDYFFVVPQSKVLISGVTISKKNPIA